MRCILLEAIAAATIACSHATDNAAGDIVGAIPISFGDDGHLVRPSIGRQIRIRLPAPGGKVAETTTTTTSVFTQTVGDGNMEINGITFSFQNLFNTSTEPIIMDKEMINLWSGTWDPSPLDAPCNGEFKPIKAGSVQYGFRASLNPKDHKHPDIINGSFLLRPKPCADCGNFSQGFAAYAFAMVPVGGGAQEIIIETEGAITDDMYSEEFGSIVGDQMVYTLVLRHRNCDPEGWSKCKACTCPPPLRAVLEQ